MFDNNMHYLSASHRWKTEYGLGDRDLRGLSHYEVFPGVSEEWKQFHRQGLGGAVLHRDADRFEWPDGAVQWLRWEIRPWNDREGRIGGILIFTEDITDRKQADDALREQAELLDLAHDTIMVCDLDETIRFWNHGAEEMYGYTKEHAAGKKSHELLGTVFPKPIDEIKAQVVGEGRWEGELAQLTRAGTGIVVASRWVLQRDKGGRPCGVMEINNDITERMRLEEAQREANVKLQTVLDSITDGLLVLDNDWRYTYFSEHGARMLGLSPEDRLGKCVWDTSPMPPTLSSAAPTARLSKPGIPSTSRSSFPSRSTCGSSVTAIPHPKASASISATSLSASALRMPYFAARNLPRLAEWPPPSPTKSTTR
jgi:PAS domain S-box-containing protein